MKKEISNLKDQLAKIKTRKDEELSKIQNEIKNITIHTNGDYDFVHFFSFF